MARLFTGLLLSIVFIAGGLSGKLVVRGTNSSTALVILGVIYLAYTIYRFIRDRKNG